MQVILTEAEYEELKRKANTRNIEVVDEFVYKDRSLLITRLLI